MSFNEAQQQIVESYSEHRDITSTFPRIALEYGHILSASSTSTSATMRSKPRSLTSTTSCWDNSMCPRLCLWVSFESLFSLCVPQGARMFVLVAFELVAHPEQRAIDRGAIVAGQFD